jgi:hypothetical protein
MHLHIRSIKPKQTEGAFTMLKNAIVAMGLFILRLMLKHRATEEMAFAIYCDFAGYSFLESDIFAEIAAVFQEDIAVHFGLPICSYCRWVIEPSQSHQYCIDHLKEEANAKVEEALAWQELTDFIESERKLAEQIEYAEDEAEAWDIYYPAMELELARSGEKCPCGHTYADHHDYGNVIKECSRCECRCFGDYAESFEDESGYEGIEPYVSFEDEAEGRYDTDPYWETMESDGFNVNYLVGFDDDGAFLEDVCPCGHKGSQHDGDYGDGNCTICDCQHFGQDTQEYIPSAKGLPWEYR